MIWKDIMGYEGYYQISDTGKIKRLPRNKRLVNGNYINLPEMELSINTKVGFPCVALNKGGKQKVFTMHKLMGLHFIENDDPSKKKEIRFKDGDNTNYLLDNIEWCTRSENLKK